ncbi:TPA: hypothetical protein NNM78_002226 [Pseudomonas aeruginosa]|nr:hypothetical protein [Pseudomonas aeruginosa]
MVMTLDDLVEDGLVRGISLVLPGHESKFGPVAVHPEIQLAYVNAAGVRETIFTVVWIYSLEEAYGRVIDHLADVVMPSLSVKLKEELRCTYKRFREYYSLEQIVHLDVVPRKVLKIRAKPSLSREFLATLREWKLKFGVDYFNELVGPYGYFRGLSFHGDGEGGCGALKYKRHGKVAQATMADGLYLAYMEIAHQVCLLDGIDPESELAQAMKDGAYPFKEFGIHAEQTDFKNLYRYVISTTNPNGMPPAPQWKALLREESSTTG